MNIRHKDIFIPVDGSDPFTNCKLNRASYAESLSNIIKNYADGFVLAINNTWGEGKTTFLQMWRQSLINEGFGTLYYNAWENDHENDVLIALISELEELRDNKSKVAFKTMIKNAAPLTKKIIPAVARAMVEKYLGSDVLAEIAEGVSEFGSETIEEQLKSYSNRKKSLGDFRNSLEKFVKKSSESRPVVFIVDELDRCRPNYAVEVLEQIKHLFSVPGIVFVLAVDKTELMNSIKGAYGSENLNAEEYLRRFIDVEYSIPDSKIGDFSNYLYEYFDLDDFFSSEERKKIGEFKTDKSYFLTVSKEIFKESRFTLRQLEKIFAHIKIILSSFRYNEYVFPDLISLLVFFKVRHLDVYKYVSQVEITPQELFNKVEKIIHDMDLTKNNANINYTIAKLLVFYSNQYRPKFGSHPLVERLDGGEKKFSIESQINPDSIGELERAVYAVHDDWNIDSLQINHLTDKINLIKVQ